jgi:hypothetical protein
VPSKPAPQPAPRRESKPLPRRKPGPRPTNDWKAFITAKVREFKRRHKPIPPAKFFCQLCEDKLGYQPDTSHMNELLRNLRK